MAANRTYQHVVMFLCVMALTTGFIFISKISMTKPIPIHAQCARFNKTLLEFNTNNTEYLERLGFNDYKEVNISNGIPNLTIITGFSSNHVPEGRNMIVDANNTLPGKIIVVYGMDLSDNEKQWFKDACNVDYRDFYLSNYPKYVQPANYRFKPLIIAEALKEFDAILWADTSTFFTGEPISNLLTELIKPEEPHVYLLGTASHTTYAATHPDMYKFLPCFTDYTLHRRWMSVANRMVFIRTKSTMEKALKWFVLCALEEECMAPNGSQLLCDFDKLWDGVYANCHRYDQSAISLILAPYDNSHLTEEMIRPFLFTERDIEMNETAVVQCPHSK